MMETALKSFRTSDEFCNTYRAYKAQIAELDAKEKAAIKGGQVDLAGLAAEKLEKVRMALEETVFREVERLWTSFALDGYEFPIDIDCFFYGRVIRLEFEPPNPYTDTPK